MKKPAIPQVPRDGHPRAPFDQAVKETLEIVTGRRAGRIEPLPAGASTNDVIAKVNEIIARLQS
ncbi:MAG: hypothetical protein ACK418_26315 [Pseudomonas sp.]|uniref:hypothetical protein n=1 Tax=Pseudomonas sp. TaxID=306 RepID=UPI00391C6B82